MPKPSANLRVFKPKQRLAVPGKHELTISSISSDGRGIAKFNGKTVFVSGALPGEQVLARFTASRKNYDEAACLKVLQTSPDRVQPACEYYGSCGGCSFQHFHYQGQVSAKQQQLQQLFKPHEQRQGQAIAWQPPLVAEAYHYRHRVRFAIQAKGKQFSLGFRQAGSHDVIAVDSCAIADQAINRSLAAVKILLSGLSKRSLLVECAIAVDAQNKLSMLLSAKADLPEQDYQQLQDFSQRQAMAVTVVHSEQPYAAALFSSPEQTRRYYLNEAMSIEYQAGDFTQVNSAINQQMIKQLIAWLQLSGQDVVADYFCGIGNLSLPMAAGCQQVQAYELVESMVAKASANAVANGLTNIEFICADLFSPQLSPVRTANKIVLDPPRAGAKQLCELLAQQKADKLLYISCNPATLARDAELLQQGGYVLSRAALIDMFPQTKHMECMVLLEKT
ncbi:23S rRNA (uracil(1939)-C(5))-methyltransferase RlmD [Dasania sp. GY-MA-18]|uniref:23S rRNA (Uracil(1939)-C(5))-methyltransferase RlmD n=1 Tax=Dasania phycosphaerae TaxID=2950436 RepID=A0A9J6RIX2_9GAMM|nr:MULTISPECIES: 23S rRNA (uracil(1939)-C(5))-methyltransferase RlmD [Dasania]MCR8921772.1 23S rRNA (uracil(1939)-C(5))-methyltransferase RlmD [Dasania sp. GY-MA-18]MCZ0864200.1 23S rRNA (uracil(1939)-C(5))-methyltransferase RlmD [Dasania phycosphaerae]MCZ0867928.1 23S rRNA (uracil(1939)-C(5))-methyltransferase RlmD [Dasania phycosphaerae]